eukprot:GHRQ01008457.1.p1 GENE.GHRQ01008457.1~~GHRQ01008457.1.p1  ORF type:complete len:202 (+),score=27.05 GHRQ01008457.1:191-796(+)
MAERGKEKVPIEGAELIEKYITELGPIPERLHRNFRLIRDLDERSAQLQAQVDEMCRQQMEALHGKAGQAKRARHSPEDQALSKSIQAMQQQIINMAEEKVCSLAGTAVVLCQLLATLLAALLLSSALWRWGRHVGPKDPAIYSNSVQVHTIQMRAFCGVGSGLWLQLCIRTHSTCSIGGQSRPLTRPVMCCAHMLDATRR